MARAFYLYNTLSHQKELFKPVHPGMVGMYVCGPTVYGDAHLGHARPGITYDVLFRLFRKLGYKVRYVRNITDVGHLENDADTGEDKIAKKARLEQLEPMEVVQTYTLRYHDAMRRLNVLPPSIEPRASGHIIEQIALVKKILEAGYAYESSSTTTGSSPAATWKIPAKAPATSTARTTSTPRSTSPFGKRRPPSISCTGPHPGAKASRAGIWNARP